MEFREFPKMARLFRDVCLTEKIDGTNAQIYLDEDLNMKVGSRSRWITPEDDNFGFAKWAYDHYEELKGLGPGRHFGEWWGSGIQRGYGLEKGEKRFSLFNTLRWAEHGEELKPIPNGNPKAEVKYQQYPPACCHVVPELYRGEFSTEAVNQCLFDLRNYGSEAAEGFSRPEGVVVFHIAGNVGFKVTLENDGIPKSLVK